MAEEMFVGKEGGKASVLNPMNFILHTADPGSLGLLAAEMKAGFYYTGVKRWRRVCTNIC